MVMRQVYRAGEKAFVDYAGPKFEVVDRSTGEVCDAMVFVGVLGASNYTFVDATWSRALPDWVMSHVQTFEFWGGVPELVIPDNEKAGVRKGQPLRAGSEPDVPGTGHALRNHGAAGTAPRSAGQRNVRKLLQHPPVPLGARLRVAGELRETNHAA